MNKYIFFISAICATIVVREIIIKRRTAMSQWSNKDERKYEHIKDSVKKRGKSTKRAKEIAARTVNKDRREEGRTPNKKSQGTGNPTTGLESRSKDELYNEAKKLNIEGRSKMNKSDLIKAIRKKR